MSEMADYVDLPHAETVEIKISADGQRVWIDTEVGNICRIYGIKELVVTDLRKRKDE